MYGSGQTLVFALLRRAYSVLFALLLPLILLRLLVKSIARPAYRIRWSERFGHYGGKPTSVDLWIHAVSVGEAQAAFPIIAAFRASAPGSEILVTCTTPTGSGRIREVLGDSVRHVYLPYDLPSCVARFLAHFSPRVGVIMETEIWPNLFFQCGQAAVPLLIANGRLSERSLQGYRHVAPLMGPCLASVRAILAQSEADARRYRAIGAVPASVSVVGNVKFDIGFTEDLREKAAAFRQAHSAQRPTWIAGSTHPREDEIILDAAVQVLTRIPEALFILAPRHPERIGEIVGFCQKWGLSWVLRTRMPHGSIGASVLLVDSLGELRWLYGAADVAFVGGSLVARGGHNVLEPAAAGLPVLFGPHTFNFAEITEGLAQAGGGHCVTDATELAGWVSKLLEDSEMRRSMAIAGAGFLRANQGAVARTIEWIERTQRTVDPDPSGDGKSSAHPAPR